MASICSAVARAFSVFFRMVSLKPNPVSVSVRKAVQIRVGKFDGNILEIAVTAVLGSVQFQNPAARVLFLEHEYQLGICFNAADSIPDLCCRVAGFSPEERVLIQCRFPIGRHTGDRGTQAMTSL